MVAGVHDFVVHREHEHVVEELLHGLLQLRHPLAVHVACATGSRCLTGTSEPLFFHPDGGGHLVYDETGLCRFFSCGALAGGETAERGTWRVMGGGPLHAAPSREEPGQESPNPVVNGGDV